MCVALFSQKTLTNLQGHNWSRLHLDVGSLTAGVKFGLTEAAGAGGTSDSALAKWLSQPQHHQPLADRLSQISHAAKVAADKLQEKEELLLVKENRIQELEAIVRDVVQKKSNVETIVSETFNSAKKDRLLLESSARELTRQNSVHII